MKRIFLMTAFILASTVFVTAQEYMVFSIPSKLTDNANAVLRKSETVYHIKNPGSFTCEETYAITILNAGGEEHAQFVLPYNKLFKVKDIEGTIYNSLGLKIRSLKKSEIKDYSATESSFADDNRIKEHNFNHRQYPYTIEYKTEVSYDGLFYFPVWMPLEDENFSVQQSTLRVIMPKDYKLRTKSFSQIEPVSNSVEKSERVIVWQVQDLAAIKREPFSTPWYENTTALFLAPSDFKLQDYDGNMEDWNALGKFMYKLNEGRDELPPLIKEKVKQLTTGISDNKEKIKILYRFMQQSTRYISIQLGIGGWQTFPADYVASNGYGDCKALTNYMHSLLKEAGIQSSFALIKAGDNSFSRSFLPDFSSNQFNHVILCIPQKDTIWLECTSQTSPVGYLGSFTSNRNTLLYDQKGGELTMTPKYNVRENLQYRSIQAELDESGNVKMHINTEYRAEQQDGVHGMVNGLSKERISEYLKEYLQIPSYEVTSFEYKQLEGELPSISEKLLITGNNYATITGKRMFIVPNILNRTSIRLPDQTKRITPLNITSEYTDVDSISFNVPAGFSPEMLPKGTELSTPFGKYKSFYEYTPGKIIYIRKMQTTAGRFPSKDAVAFKEFYDAVYAADRARIVLKRD